MKKLNYLQAAAILSVIMCAVLGFVLVVLL
jgi:hypothetical protein